MLDCERHTKDIISLKEAKAKGLKYYFTGKPCLNGGIAARLVSGSGCMCQVCYEGRLARARQYKKDNRDTVRATKRQWNAKNPEAKKVYDRRTYEKYRETRLIRVGLYREENRETIAERQRLYYKNNRDDRLGYMRRYNEEKPEKALANNAKRRAYKRRAIPVWFSEFDQFVIEEAYDLAAQRLIDTGVEWHVDHMIPLKARKASGLHCADNIQVIPALMNASKHNKMILTKPLEFLR